MYNRNSKTLYCLSHRCAATSTGPSVGCENCRLDFIAYHILGNLLSKSLGAANRSGVANRTVVASVEFPDFPVPLNLPAYIQGLEKRFPGQLSGGQQQRVALARSLAYEPEALLLDEPFSAMDTYLREGLRLELADALKDYDGVTVMVTHDRDEAYQLCDNLLLMDRGYVLAAGRTRDIFQNPVTCRAARLTGCKNISRIERLGERRIRAVDWDGLELATDRPVGDDITSVGIRAHDFEPLSESSARAYMEREDANLIKVCAPCISEMPFEWYITLQNGLWWKKEKDIHTHDTAGVVPRWLRVEPSALLLLTGEL